MIHYAITGRAYLGCVDVQRWRDAGVEFVQLRDKTLAAGELARVARLMLCDLAGDAMLLVNGRADVAAVAGAAGVHLTARPGELTPEQVRRVFDGAARPAPVISVSCHTLAEVDRARDSRVDLILFGPVYEKRVGVDTVSAGVGLDALRSACDAAQEVRVLALGGVTAENAAACIGAGAAGLAGIRLFG